MTASLQTKRDTVYVVLHWKQGKVFKQKWVPTDLPTKYSKRAGEAAKWQVLHEWTEKITPAKDYKDMMFSEFLVQWCEEKEPFIEETTYLEYRRMIKNSISPYFDEHGIKLQQCGVKEIEDFYMHKRCADGVSENTIKHYQACISSAFKDGMRKKIIASNPATDVRLGKMKKFRGEFYNTKETQRLLSVTAGTKMEIPVYLSCWFGLRRGEISGLRWEDVDLDEKTLTVRGVVIQMRSGTPRFKYRAYPKSDAGIRMFCLEDPQVKMLRRWKTEQWKNRLRLGSGYSTEWEGFVCLGPDGRLITPEYISYTFPSILSKHGLRKIRFHDLRHTNASLLLSNGATMQEVQGWLGHESYSTTDEFYGGIQREVKKHTSGILQDVLLPKEGKVV